MIRKAEKQSDYLIIQHLAEVIYPEVYNAHVHPDHVKYFVKTYQSASAIEKQVSENSEYYIHYENEIPIAYLGFDIHPHKIFLSKLYVLREHRAKGIGDQLMEILYKRASQLEIQNLELFVNENALKSIQFYEKRGFQKGELLTHSFDNGHSVQDYLMTRILNPE